MVNLNTKYLGLDLKNPIVVGSSDISSSVKGIHEIEQSGAAAVVLKSLFEEQINMDLNKEMGGNTVDHTEANHYIADYISNYSLDKYIKLVQQSKSEVSIPVIASINCVSDKDWVSYAQQIQTAGADAVEINIAVLPSNFDKDGAHNEKSYFKILKKIRKAVSIPVSLKMGYYSAGLANLIQKLSYSGYIDGFVMFNRYYMPDIDIKNEKIVHGSAFSNAHEISNSLRWIALMRKTVSQSMAASTGVHQHGDVIKQILAGADAVQMVSSLYLNGIGHVSKVLEGVQDWMQKKEYKSLDQFRGKLSYGKSDSPEIFERTQFMNYHNGKYSTTNPY